MNEIATRLNAYIQSHPFDAGDSGCETVLEQLYQAYIQSHEGDPEEIKEGFQELEEFLGSLPKKTTMQCLPYVVTCAASTNGWHSWTACNTARD